MKSAPHPPLLPVIHVTYHLDLRRLARGGCGKRLNLSSNQEHQNMLEQTKKLLKFALDHVTQINNY